MARLTLQIGSSLVVAITAPRLLFPDWRIQSLVEAGIAATVRHNFRSNDCWRLDEPTASGAVARERGQPVGVLQ